MIIANVSPSICSAAETLSTLKFAQRAKLIQNNAVVNEDASGDVIALQHQIRLLKEELAVLKRQNVSRSLSFRSAIFGDADGLGSDVANAEDMPGMVPESFEDPQGSASLGIVRLSTKQMKSLESTLTGALRREQMADTSMRQLEAEIEQLNRLVRQREEDTQCSKMMLKFREDKIQRMESLVGGLIPADTYLLEENSALSEELQLLRFKVDRNPEVTRFALENIRLLEKLRKFQDFYEEGERELLLAEVSELRDQLLQFLDENTRTYSNQNLSMPPQDVSFSREHDSYQFELKKTHKELEDCKNNLDSCLEINAKLTREIEQLQSQMNNIESLHDDKDAQFESCKESFVPGQAFNNHLHEAVEKEKETWKHETVLQHTEDIMNLHLELDILKMILQEERSSRVEVEEKVLCLGDDLEKTKEKYSLIRRQFEVAKNELKDARSVIEALESQQILSINELEDLKSGDNYSELLSKKEQEISMLKEQLRRQELKHPSVFRHLENDDFSLQTRLKGMHDSLEKAKRLNLWYKSDRADQTSNEQEMEEVRRQVEAETAEVIVCLQDELVTLQQQVEHANAKYVETKDSLMMLETEKEDLKGRLYLMTQDKESLHALLQEKDAELNSLSEEWERLASEIEEIIADGHGELKDASDQVDLISRSFSRRTWISEQVERVIKAISDKEVLIDELRRGLEEAQNLRGDMEWKLSSLRGAALAITEVQLQESNAREKEVLMLTSELGEKTSIISKLENIIKTREAQISKAEICATIAFVIVNRLSEKNSDLLDSLKFTDLQLSETRGLNLEKDAYCQNQVAVIKEAEQQVQALRIELECSKESCIDLQMKLSEEQERVHAMNMKLDEADKLDILKTKEKLDEFKLGVSTLNSCMNEYSEDDGRPQVVKAVGLHALPCKNVDSEGLTVIETCQVIGKKESASVGRAQIDAYDKDTTIVLLRKEIESALDSFREVQAQMVKLREEKEMIRKSETESWRSMKFITSQVLTLQSETEIAGKQSALKITELEHKLQTVDERVQEARSDWFQKKEMLETELCDAKVSAAQKSAEASSLLAKLEEAQETMKEAELMVNALMTKNEAAKLEIERLQKLEVTLTSARDSLMQEVRSMQSSNDQKDQEYDILERQLCSELSQTREAVLALEDIITESQIAFKENFNSIISDFHCLKSQVLHSTSLTRSWLEDIWSEIIVKDCAVSVLHLCHMGVLLEAVTGLNAENGLLHHGLCESNSVIADLKENNFKAKKELEMCRILKGKLLVDIKNSFDRVSRKEDETGKFSAKLSAFEKKILDLQLQEEQMLARSNSMGSELALLMKDLDVSNMNAFTSLLDQEKLLRDKEELIMLDSTSKSFESLILTSELVQMAVGKASLEREQEAFRAILENIKKEVIFLTVEAELGKHLCIDLDVDVALLEKVVEGTVSEKEDLSRQLKECHIRLAETDEVNKALARDIHSLKGVAYLNDKLKEELGDVLGSKERLSSQIHLLEIQNERLVKDLRMKEAALEGLVSELQMEMDRKDAELKRMSTIEEENKTLKSETKELKANNCRILEEKNSEIESSYSRINVFDQENRGLKEKICSLETCIASLHTDCDMRNEELDKVQRSQSSIEEELNLKSQDLEIKISNINSLKDENDSLRSKLMSVEQCKDDIVTLVTLNLKNCSDSFEAVKKTGNRVLQVINEKNIVLLDKMFNEILENEEKVSKFIAECECVENFVKELMSENLSLQSELSRKDDVLEGLLFDLSMLQESASNAKDQKDKFEQMVAAMETLEDELALRSSEAEEAVACRQLLEAQLQEKINLCSILEMDISVERKSLQHILDENVELRAEMEDILLSKGSIEEELIEKSQVTERLEEELFQMDNALGQMNTYLEDLKNDLNRVTNERDHLNLEVLALEEKFEATQTLAEENEAIAVEARQIAESRKTYAEEKEEEVKLLERSVEELEYTVDVLENKVSIVKGEAERQRLQREELEMELESIRNQMQIVQTSCSKMKLEMQSIMSEEADLQRHLEEKEGDLQEARQQFKDLEKNMAEKDAEISQFRSHISELNLHAEAQAREYKQKFKQLEAMAEHVKPEPVSSNVANSLSNKPEKNAVKSRGSGSPFKCIGLGLTQQINSEKDEELTAGRRRIEELEALAANRQKEIFMLNARLATAESMTHDVIRDLLGVKLDMTNYASLLDHQQMQKITEKTRVNSDECLVKDQEVVKLKQQLNEFIEERQGWLDEINRRHAEIVALQVTSEKLRERDQFLTAENEMLKMDNLNHKKRVMELENDVKKLSGQQNLQQRIHHHAKIKEENNVLKVHNEELSAKLRRSETILSRVKEENARYRASEGRSPYIDLDEEQRLQNKLKETEEERLQLAQKLLSLYTSILKAAGITRPVSDVDLSVAEDALNQLNIRIASLERKLQDLEFKNKITSERIRLSELKQQSSPLGSRTDDNCMTPERTSRSPFLTAFDR